LIAAIAKGRILLELNRFNLLKIKNNICCVSFLAFPETIWGRQGAGRFNIGAAKEMEKNDSALSFLPVRSWEKRHARKRSFGLRWRFLMTLTSKSP